MLNLRNSHLNKNYYLLDYIVKILMYKNTIILCLEKCISNYIHLVRSFKMENQRNKI